VLPFRVLALSEDSSFKILEGYHDDSDIIKTLSVERILENSLNAESTLVMDVVSFLGLPGFVGEAVEVAAVPRALDALLGGEFVENTITSEDDEVVVLRDLELLDVWVRDHHVGVAAPEL